jgi:hypothetical protein
MKSFAAEVAKTAKAFYRRSLWLNFLDGLFDRVSSVASLEYLE